MQYNRFISYIHHYHNGEKMENTGFVKVERKGAYVRFSMRSKILERVEMPYRVMLICKPEYERCRGILLVEQPVTQGEFTYRYVTKYEQMAGNHLRLEDICGVLIQGDFEHAYMTVWEDLKLTPNMVEWQENKEPEVTESLLFGDGEEDVETAACKDEEGEPDTLEAELSVSENEVEPGLSYLFHKRSKLPLFEGSEIYDCIRIEPQDIGLLEMKFWKYGNNSFLSHGYYRYHYLLLGKLRFQDEEEKIILGVPSIYNQKEKELANMFGFEQFVSVKRTDRKQGEFGYWIVEL